MNLFKTKAYDNKNFSDHAFQNYLIINVLNIIDIFKFIFKHEAYWFYVEKVPVVNFNNKYSNLRC